MGREQQSKYIEFHKRVFENRLRYIGSMDPTKPLVNWVDQYTESTSEPRESAVALFLYENSLEIRNGAIVIPSLGKKRIDLHASRDDIVLVGREILCELIARELRSRLQEIVIEVMPRK